MRAAPLLAALLPAAAAGAAPWLAGYNRSFPNHVLFVKGKKVAGTTLGGVVRRLGRRHGVDFFSPEPPKKPPGDWRRGGRERWTLEEFGRFAARRRGNATFVGWGQEQTLSPRRAGLEQSSAALRDLARSALRLTVVREPVAHAVSACTHFGPCGSRAQNVKAAYSSDVGERLRWVREELTTSQMLRFVAPDPGDMAGDRAAAFYHAVLLADAVDESLVALALSLRLDLADCLYVSAKTTHTARRPATETLGDDFRDGLTRLFYPASPDAALYLAAKARLEATVEALGARHFEAALRRFRKMQARMLQACARPGDRPKRALPGGLHPREAAACLYGDQGCGHRCIDAWLVDREARLRARGGERAKDRDAGLQQLMASRYAARAPAPAPAPAPTTRHAARAAELHAVMAARGVPCAGVCD